MTDQENPNMPPLFRRYGHRMADLPRIMVDVAAVPDWAWLSSNTVADSDDMTLVEVSLPLCLTDHGFIYAGVRYMVDDTGYCLDQFEMTWGEEADNFSGFFMLDEKGAKWYFAKNDPQVPALRALWSKFRVQ